MGAGWPNFFYFDAGFTPTRVLHPSDLTTNAQPLTLTLHMLHYTYIYVGVYGWPFQKMIGDLLTFQQFKIWWVTGHPWYPGGEVIVGDALRWSWITYVYALLTSRIIYAYAAVQFDQAGLSTRTPRYSLTKPDYLHVRSGTVWPSRIIYTYAAVQFEQVGLSTRMQRYSLNKPDYLHVRSGTV